MGPYRAGDIIAGKYQLVRVLCQGGMGSVWVAYNQVLDVQVALKLIRPDVKGAFIAERFMTEGRLAARLEHPAIIGVHDLGNTDRGDPFLVMELLHGEDLRTLLEAEGKLTPERAVALLLPIAEGMALAHARGVVHRDLKPENVFLARSDERLQPKVLDFGVAKPALAPGQRRITRAGAVVGSPDYMSPEQARGLDVDHRADVWAFCAVLYECVTGRAPFADSAYDMLLRDIVEKPVRPFSALGVDQPELWAILERGLQKDRDARYSNMRELGRELASWLRLRGVEEDVCGQSLRAAWLRSSQPELGTAEERGLSPSPELCAPAPARSTSASCNPKPRGLQPATPTALTPTTWMKRVATGSFAGAAQLRAMAMLTCSALLGAAAVQFSSMALGASGPRLRSGSAALSAAAVARHGFALREQVRLAEPRKAADAVLANTESPRSTPAAATLPRPRSQQVATHRAPNAAASSKQTKAAAGWPFTAPRPNAAPPPPVRATAVGRSVKAKMDPEFGF